MGKNLSRPTSNNNQFSWNFTRLCTKELLLPKLQDTMKSSEVRVVILSSLAGAACYNLDPSKLPCPKEEYNEFAEYAVSKVWWLHVSFFLELDEWSAPSSACCWGCFSCFFFCVKMGRIGSSFPKTSIKNLFWTSQVGGAFFLGALRKAVDCLHARYLQKSQGNMVACAVHPGIIGTGLGGVIQTWDLGGGNQHRCVGKF